MKHKIINIIGLVAWIIFSGIVALIAFYLIIIANGYKINYQTKTIQKTGMIYIKSKPSDVDIYLNNTLDAAETPYKKGDLTPARYDVKISKPDYENWSYTFHVEEGKTRAKDYVILFLAEPVAMDVSEEEANLLSMLVEQWPPKGLDIAGGEIWFNDVYITRFSSDIKAVSWHTDLKHIFLQVDNKILVMEPDGANMVDLVELSSSDPSEFIVLNNGAELLYRDEGEVRKARIQ